MDISNKFIEQFYENVILPRYGDSVDIKSIAWKDHGKVDLDAWAHYFDDADGREFVLIYEDFPGGNYLADDLTHEIVPFGNETSLKLSFNDDTLIENVTGYFTLYREKIRQPKQ